MPWEKIHKIMVMCKEENNKVIHNEFCFVTFYYFKILLSNINQIGF